MDSIWWDGGEGSRPRGEVLVDQHAAPGQINAQRGRGRFLARQRTDALQPAGRQIPEMAQLAAWNTPLSL